MMFLMSLPVCVFIIWMWKIFLEECAKPKCPQKPLQTKQSSLKLFERIDD